MGRRKFLFSSYFWLCERPGKAVIISSHGRVWDGVASKGEQEDGEGSGGEGE